MLFLDAVDAQQPCGIVLLDLRMPGKSGGAEVQAELAARGMRVAGHHADRPRRRRLGAQHAEGRRRATSSRSRSTTSCCSPRSRRRAREAAAAEESAARKAETDRRLARLTPRERQVLAMVVDGRHNREVAAALGISPRTVEVYKARLMDKLDVERLPDLIRLSLEHSLHERG